MKKNIKNFKGAIYKEVYTQITLSVGNLCDKLANHCDGKTAPQYSKGEDIIYIDYKDGKVDFHINIEQSCDTREDALRALDILLDEVTIMREEISKLK